MNLVVAIRVAMEKEDKMDKMIKVIYELSKEGQKQNILAGGNGKAMQEFTTPVTEKLIKFAEVDDEGNLTLKMRFFPEYRKIPIKDNEYSSSIEEITDIRLIGYWHDIYNKFYNKFDTTQTIDTINTFIDEKLKEYEELKANIEKNNKEAHEKFEEEKKIKLAEEQANLERSLKNKINKATQCVEEAEGNRKETSISHAEYYVKELPDVPERVALLERLETLRKDIAEKVQKIVNERKEWILKYGSQYLKDCLEMDIKANKEYVFERAALEFPDFEVDYKDNAGWEEKVSPSQKAIDELKDLWNKDIKSEIVWLTNPIDENDEYGFESCEAIAIRNFLGKYDLIKII